MHPLDGSFLKLRRAKEHLNVVNDLMQGFQNRKPYRIVDSLIRDRQTGERLLRFKQFEDIPPDVPLVIGDICNNLRSALDHLLWQLWLLKKPSFNGNVFFPICDTEDSFKSQKTWSYIKGLSEVQRAAIESLQPYKTRNPALSLLRDINNSDKHRLIQVIGVVVDVDRLRVTADQTRALIKVPQPRRRTIRLLHNVKIKNGAILAWIPLNGISRGTYVRVQSDAIIRFVFEGSKSANGQFIGTSLDAMISEVSHAITLLEPEFAQFGTSTFKG